MEITQAVQTEQGILINGTHLINPGASNWLAQEYAKWLAEGNLPLDHRPHGEQDYYEQVMKCQQAAEFLSRTDWMVVRNCTNPEQPVPANVIAIRAAAREVLGSDTLPPHDLFYSDN